MRPLIRPFEDRDAEAVVGLSLRACAPVFAPLERVLGYEIFGLPHPDWREDQRRAVEAACAAKRGRVWVAEVGASAVGFVAVEVDDPGGAVGEISMLAVDPDRRGDGIGTAMTEFALDRLKGAGMKVAMVETGGDPGRAAARRAYERAGYHLLPIAPGTSRTCSRKGECPTKAARRAAQQQRHDHASRCSTDRSLAGARTSVKRRGGPDLPEGGVPTEVSMHDPPKPRTSKPRTSKPRTLEPKVPRPPDPAGGAASPCRRGAGVG